MFLRLTFIDLSTLEKFKITLEQVIQTVKVRTIVVTEYFLTFPVFSYVRSFEKCGLLKFGKIRKNNFQILFFCFRLAQYIAAKERLVVKL
jgi:hypothetical protein